MHLAEQTAGNDFTRIRFNPWNGDKSIVTVTSFRNIDHKDFTFEKVTKIGRTGMKDIKVNVNGGKYDNDR